MSESNLHFNGIKPDGSYALPPQTVKELADHIKAERNRARELSEQLARALRSTDKAMEIVSFLVTHSLALLDGADVSREAWFTALARQLLTTILGDTAAGEGNVRELARQLQQDTSKIEKIVSVFLKQGVGQNSQELAAWLLPQKTDDGVSFKESLKRQVQHGGGVIVQEMLSPAQAVVLETQPARRSVWLAELCRQLRELPLESLKALTENRGIVTTPLRQLVAELQTLPDTGSPWLTQLIHDLNPLYRLGKYASWPTLVNILEHDLTPLVQGGDTAPDGAVSVAWGALLAALTRWINVLLGSVGRLGPVPWVDPLNLSATGWGVIFPAQMPAERPTAIQAALHPLLEWRKQQAGPLYKIYAGGEGYRPGEDARAFLKRLGADPAQPADPQQSGVPYYLLLVGSPEEIPFEFQYSLDVQYAVGRIDFDAIEGYHTYACSVVAAEQEDFCLAPEVTFFPVSNPRDDATWLSARYLIAPLADHLRKRVEQARSQADPHAGLAAWHIDVIPSEQATRAKLLEVLTREKAPALLFTAGHGMQFDPDDPARQRANQGALVCADWQGPDEKQVVPEYYLSGEVLAERDDANLLGAVVFLFACYSAGTPKTDDYYRQDFMDKGKVIAERPFVAALPQAMLSLSKGGALAVIGHIERVWSLSYLGPESPSRLGEERRDEHLAVFESMLDHVLRGYPVGAAMDYFGTRYAALSTELTAAWDAFTEPDEFQLAELWTANHDARGYVIIGDPAVRLRVAQTPVVG
ncbi:MAG TPA: hypothetical protein PLH19_15820 [Anaerolineae bacterium]|nr:hypothetical protein [Anaerolineae bacterium]HQH39981.1 hypothetical protein [Anaerolineae bacterium]